MIDPRPLYCPASVPLPAPLTHVCVSRITIRPTSPIAREAARAFISDAVGVCRSLLPYAATYCHDVDRLTVVLRDVPDSSARQYATAIVAHLARAVSATRGIAVFVESVAISASADSVTEPDRIAWLMSMPGSRPGRQPKSCCSPSVARLRGRAASNRSAAFFANRRRGVAEQHGLPCRRASGQKGGK